MTIVCRRAAFGAHAEATARPTRPKASVTHLLLIMRAFLMADPISRLRPTHAPAWIVAGVPGPIIAQPRRVGAQRERRIGRWVRRVI